MKQIRLLTLLVLLAAVVSGAWATTPNSIVINGTPQVGNKSISLTYYFDPANVPGITSYAPTLKVKCAADNKWDEMNLSLTEVSSGTTNISLSTLGEFEAGKTYEVCFAYNNGNWVDEVFQTFVPAAAGYTVSLKDGVKDADNWTVKVGEGQAQALPIGGLKGDGSETVTLQYNGRLKVKSVKAVKKNTAKTLAEATSEDIGKIAGKDGKIYATKADAEAVATGNAVAMIAYVGTASDCAHGLAIALADESGTKDYEAAGTACSGKAAVTGGTWRLPSDKDWQYMFIGCGSSEAYSAPTFAMSKSYSGLASKLTTAQGAALQTVEYWSSTKDDPNGAWIVVFNVSNATFYMEDKTVGHRVRACLAF